MIFALWMCVTVPLLLLGSLWGVLHWIGSPAWCLGTAKWLTIIYSPVLLCVMVATAKDGYKETFGDPNRHHVGLAKEQKLGDVLLPAGASATMYRDRLQKAQLPPGAHVINGLRLTGTVEFYGGLVTKAILAEDSELDGEWCARGTEVQIDPQLRRPTKFTLARQSKILKQQWPAGTVVERFAFGPQDQTYFHLPVGEPVKIIEGIPLGTAPDYDAGFRNSDARLKTVSVDSNSGRPAFLTLGGLEICGFVTFGDDGTARGQLRADTLIDGENRYRGTFVTVSVLKR